MNESADSPTSRKPSVDHGLIVMEAQVYDLSAYAKLGITHVAIKAFIAFRSTNESKRSRITTNNNLYYKIRDFLRFALIRSEAGYIAGFDQATYQAFLAFNVENRRPSTEVTVMAVVRRLFRFAFEKGFAKSFNLPRPTDQKVAYATSRGSETIADAWQTLPEGIANRVELNKLILTELHDHCWTRIHQLRDRQALAATWRRELAYKFPFPRIAYSTTRDEALKALVLYVWSQYDGYLPQTVNDRSSASKAHRDEDMDRRRIYALLKRHFYQYVPRITIEELCDYLRPTYRQLCVFLPLFAAKGINPESIYMLKTDMLVASDDGRVKILWEKPRSNEEKVTALWEKGNPNTRSIPNAWKILETLTSDLRQQAAPALRPFLFLCYGKNSFGKQITLLDNVIARKVLNTELREASERPFLNNLPRPMNLKIIRVTAGSMKRFEGSFEDTKRFFQHKNSRTTDNYLRSPAYRAFLDDKIKEGQTELLSYLRGEIKVLPNDADAICEAEGLQISEAQALVDDDLNIGYGISLLNDRAYVVDTPLNYLRMKTWLDKIRAAEMYLTARNLSRWSDYWVKQISLFNDALEDFPRKTRMASTRLNVVLNFPEPQ